jgi:allophanate hydrolase subunit 1
MGIPNKQIGIYKITSPSGKTYIGQSWNIRINQKTLHNRLTGISKNTTNLILV